MSPLVFQETRDELIERFGAVSSYLQIIRGEWVYEGSQYTDETQKIFVDVEDTPENRAFFAEYKRTLQERFEQIVIYIRSYPVEIL